MNNLSEPISGAKYRPVSWSDINQPGAPIIGWGLEQKRVNERHYKPIGYRGEIHPFESKAKAAEVCKNLNSLATIKATSR